MLRSGGFALAFAIAAAVAGARPAASGEAAMAPRPSPGCAAANSATGNHLERTIAVDGSERSYILDVPERLRPGTPVPLLLDFHGLGHSAAGVWKVSAFRDLAAADPFIAAYPDGLPVRFERGSKTFEGKGWEIDRVDGNRDVKFVVALLDHLERTYCIDRARVFATGFSNGAFLSHLLGCALSDRFAAIAPVSGGRVPVPCNPPRGVPVLIQHGRQDPLIPPEDARAARDTWVATDQCHDRSDQGCERHLRCRDTAVVEYCEEDHAHRWPPQATKRVWDFLRAHPMPERTAEEAPLGDRGPY